MNISPYVWPGLCATNVMEFCVLDAVAGYYGFAHEELIRGNRTQDLVHARYIFWYLLAIDLRLSHNSIGRKYGGYDHATVRRAVGIIANNLDKHINDITLIRSHL